MSETYYVFLMAMFIIFTLSRLISAFSDNVDSSIDESRSISTEDRQYLKAREGLSSADMENLAELAKEGHASALASFTWKCLNSDQFDRAIALYDSTRKALNYAAGGTHALKEELANVDSNHALNLLGSGMSLKDVGHLWIENEYSGNVESRFYSTIFRIRIEGAPADSIYNLSMKARQEIQLILFEGLVESDGWYGEWCDNLLNDFGTYLEAKK